MKLPGERVYSLAERYLDAATIRALIAPTIADLQHETAEAGPHLGNRLFALCRGYLSVVSLFVHCQWRLPMRSLFAVLLLGAVGAVSAIITASSTHIGPAPLAAILIVAAVSVAVLRFLRLGLTYRQAFRNCVGIGLIMTMSYSGWMIAVATRGGVPWYSYAMGLVFAALCVGFGSALAAAVVWEPPFGARPVMHTRCLQILTGCGVFAVVNIFVVLLWHSGANLASRLSWTAFMFFFFAAVASVLYLPILLVARRVIHGRLPVAVIGAVLFPLPMFGVPFLQGRGPSAAKLVSALPSTEFLAVALPYVLGGAAIGWLLAGRHPEQERTA